MSTSTGPSAPSGRPAAFFDLDKTLIAGSSLVGLARGLHKRDLCDTSTLAQLCWGQFRNKLAPVAGPPGREFPPGEAALRWVAGRLRPEVESVTNEIVREWISPRVYTDMAALVTRHNDEGFLTFVATGAPAEVAETVARRLGMTAGLGTEAETDDTGRYSGRPAGSVLHGEAKAAAVEAHAVRAGIDLARSVSYADSIADAPLLELVGRAEVVNPDGPLRRLASQRGWVVHEPRVTVHDVARDRVALVGTRLAEHGLDGFLVPDPASSTARNRHYRAPDLDAFLRAVQATGRFRRDTRIGAIYHPGRLSLREVAPAASLHVITAGDRVAVHVDQVSPLAPVQPDESCRYALGRVAAHNLTGMAGDVARLVSPRRSGRGAVDDP